MGTTQGIEIPMVIFIIWLGMIISGQEKSEISGCYAEYLKHSLKYSKSVESDAE